MECFALNFVASRLRAVALRSEDPAGASQVSARGARLSVRAILDLIRLLPPENAHSTRREQLRTYFSSEARSVLDLYALTRGHPATDCVGMLILESRYARVVGAEGPHANDRHRVALSFLEEAEARLLPMRTRHRLWLRFLIEHCSVLRGLARDAARNPSKTAAARSLLQLALFDVSQLERIVQAAYPYLEDPTHSDSMQALASAWHKAAARQRELTTETATTIGLKLD